MSRPFSLAVVGLGMAAKPHALALKSLADRIAVCGVYARSAETRDRFATEYGFPAASDLEALADDPSVDALLLITPPNARKDLIAPFVARGKHVLCEKPLERTVGAAGEIVDLCADANVELGIVFQHRFRAASQALAQLLAEGRLGAVRTVRVEVPWWRDQAYYDEPGRGTLARDGGGVLISQAIHTLDLMLGLVGPVQAVQVVAATTPLHEMETEDFVAGGLIFENGATGSLMATTAAYPGDAESIRLDCDGGAAILKSGVLTVSWRDGGTETFGDEATTGGGADPMAFPFDWHRDLIASFVDRVRDGQPPLVTGRDGLAVQKLIAALLRSSADGRRVMVSEFDG